MEGKIKEILQKALELIEDSENLENLEKIQQIRVQFLGKNGELTNVLRDRKSVV